jgi:hypothetical protein
MLDFLGGILERRFHVRPKSTAPKPAWPAVQKLLRRDEEWVLKEDATDDHYRMPAHNVDCLISSRFREMVAVGSTLIGRSGRTFFPNKGGEAIAAFSYLHGLAWQAWRMATRASGRRHWSVDCALSSPIPARILQFFGEFLVSADLQNET